MGRPFCYAIFDRPEVVKLRGRRGSNPRMRKRSGERKEMKREFLENFKVGDQPMPKEVVDAIMAENGSDIEAAKKPFSDYDAIKTQLAEADKTIEGFKGMDIESVRKEADGWKAKAEQAEKDAAAKLADMEFNGLLSAAITGAKGRSAKAVLALLDVDALKASKNREADVKAALEGLKKESGYLFDDAATPPPYAPGPGKDPILKGEYTRETFGKMGYNERLALKKEHPDIYEKVKE